jgi:hypothetical protein
MYVALTGVYGLYTRGLWFRGEFGSSYLFGRTYFEWEGLMVRTNDREYSYRSK